MTLTEQRIGELWDEAVGGGWTLDHRNVVAFVRRVESTMCAHNSESAPHNFGPTRETSDCGAGGSAHTLELTAAHDLAEALFATITGAAKDGQAEQALRRYEELRRGSNR